MLSNSEQSPNVYIGYNFSMDEGTRLTPQQKEHWEKTLEDAERMRENALRMLGKTSIENEDNII